MNKLNFFRKKDESKIEKRIEYEVGRYKMLLKNNHMIETYQAQFPLYDRFLPYFCSFFEGLIIDIGANIGDTSIAIFSQNANCFIVGVEPDEDFFNDCNENISLNDLNNRFLGIQKFISTKKGFFIIEKDKSSSTGSINANTTSEANYNTISFSELLKLIPKEKSKNFDVLKIDTDGFDWDVINSFVEVDILSKPRFIFFEMQTFLNNDASKTNQREEMNNHYLDSLIKLKEFGYTHFSLFDNFGTFVMTTDSLDDIFRMNEYVIRSQVKNHHSTIFYFDVLAFNESELEFTKNKISNFYIEK